MLAEAAVDNMVLLHLQDLEELVAAVMVLNNVDLLDPMMPLLIVRMDLPMWIAIRPKVEM